MEDSYNLNVLKGNFSLDSFWSICNGYWHLWQNKNTGFDYEDSLFCPFRFITASSFSTYSPANIDGYLVACGDSAKWPRGFKTASEAIWANNYIQRNKYLDPPEYV